MRLKPVEGAVPIGAALLLASVFWVVATSASAEEIPAAAREEAKQIYASRCAACHGVSGAGDGASAVAMNPKPRSFGDAEWQKSITDTHIDLVIVGGGPAVGKSPIMPPNPDLASKTAVVAGLRQIVRGYAK